MASISASGIDSLFDSLISSPVPPNGGQWSGLLTSTDASRFISGEGSCSKTGFDSSIAPGISDLLTGDS
jgi:hypothetical protein